MVGSKFVKRYLNWRGWLKSITALNLGIGLTYIILWGIVYTRDIYWRADYTAFYTGWSLIIRNLGHHLYDYDVQRMAQHAILGGRYLSDGLLAFYYPPHAALIGAPLALLPLKTSYLLWSILQFVLLGATVWFLWRYMRKRGVSLLSRAAALGAVVALPALMVSLLLGTFSLLMLVALLGFVIALRQDQEIGAGLWILVTTLKPQVAVIPCLLLIAGRRWRSLLVIVTGLILMVLLSSLALGGYRWVEFVKAITGVLELSDSLGVMPSDMLNVKGLLAALFGTRYLPWINFISMVAFLIVVVFVMWVWFAPSLRAMFFDLKIAVTFALGLLFGLHVNPQDALFWVIPVLFYYLYLRGSVSGSAHAKPAQPSLRLYTSIVLIAPGVFLLFERVLPISFIPVSVVMMLGLAAMMVWTLFHQRFPVNVDERGW